MKSVDVLAKKLLEYMRLDMPIKRVQAIIGIGALDTRVAERTAQLFLDGYGDYIVFTGGLGKITKHTQSQTEAERFRDIAVNMGVPDKKILVENEATNSGENIVLVQKLFKGRALKPESLLIVTKPYMERRIWAAFKKQWQDKDTEIMVTSPQITYEEHFDENIPKNLSINVMVGDLQRIREYPKLGFQVEQEIPDDVWHAYEELVKLGYTQSLMK